MTRAVWTFLVGVACGVFLAGFLVSAQDAKYQGYITQTAAADIAPTDVGDVLLSVAGNLNPLSSAKSPEFQVAARYEVVLLGSNGERVRTESGDLLELLTKQDVGPGAVYTLLDAVRYSARKSFITNPSRRP